MYEEAKKLLESHAISKEITEDGELEYLEDAIAERETLKKADEKVFKLIPISRRGVVIHNFFISSRIKEIRILEKGITLVDKSGESNHSWTQITRLS